MKTKTKAIAIIVTMLLAISLFYVLPVRAQPYIRIGIMGPEGWMQMDGMRRGAELAAEWINGPGGGIQIGGVGTAYDVSIHTGDEHAADMRPDLARAEMIRLITVEEVDVIYGGFRSEMVYPIRTVATDYNKLYTICGAATNDLIDCGTGTCGACVRCDYDTYKYVFRATPINATMLVYNILGFVRYYLLPARLAPLYGSPVNTCVISEDLDWTVVLHAMLSGGYLGPQANIVYAPRIPWDATDLTPYLDEMHAKDVRLVVQIFSAPLSVSFISQMTVHPLKAVAAGIDVLGQGTEFWDLTGGSWDPPAVPGGSSVKAGCEYEAFLATTGTRTPMSTLSQPYTTVQVWDRYYAAYDSAPIYTTWGVYDSIIALHDLLEAVPPGTVTPPFETDGVDARALIPYLEQTDREGVVGRFKYTGPHPTIAANPTNPNKIGTLHDVFSVDFLATWPTRYVRAMWVQWQAGRHEVVWPLDLPFSRMFVLPPKMYPYPTDVDQDGAVTGTDLMIEGYALASYAVSPYVEGPPGSFGVAHPAWQFLADASTPSPVPPAPGTWYIDGADNVAVSFDMGKTVALPLVYCDEAGHLS